VRSSESEETVAQAWTVSLCGELRLEIRGQRRESILRGRHGRMVLGYLVLNRSRAVPRHELEHALWGTAPPADPGSSLRAHLSRLRTALGEGVLCGSGELRLLLPDHAAIDVEQASASLGLAEAALREGSWKACLEAALGASMVLERPLLPGLDAEWIDAEARRLESGALRALELTGISALELEPPDGSRAELVARALVERSPFREGGHRLLVRSLLEQEEIAEALRAYDAVRTLFREELGVVPGPELRDLHAEALDRAGDVRSARRPDGWQLPPRLAAPAPSGRASELAQLGCTIRSGREALIEGEAGIGKTRLIAAVAAELHADGWGVLYGRCQPDGAIPYEPIVEALEGAAEARGAAELEQLARDAGVAVAPLVPALPLERRAVPATPADPGTARWRLRHAAVRLLDTLAAERPLLLAIDDLHNASAATLALVRHFGEASGERVATLAAYRMDELPFDHPVVQRADRLRADGQVLRLSGLEPHALGELFTMATGRHSSPETLEALHRATGGNPLYVTQLVRHAVDSGTDLARWRPAERSEDAPRAVRELVGRRAARLDPRVREALSTAAVIGREFELSTLARVTGGETWALLKHLEQGRIAGVIEEVVDDPTRFAFIHALVRRVLYDDQLSVRLHETHRRVAAALEEGPEPDPAELAHHWSAAGPRGDDDKVLSYSREAAARAAASLSHSEAAAHYRRALEAGRGRLAATPELELLLAVARSEAQAGRLEAAREAARRAAHVARRCGDEERFARAALAFAATGGAVAIDAYQMDFAREASALLVAAERLLPAADTPLRVRLLAELASHRLTGLGRDRRRVLASEASAMAQRLGDEPGELTALRTRVSPALRGPYDLEEAIAAAGRAAELAVSLNDLAGAFDAHRLLAAARFELGEIDAMDSELCELERVASQTRAATHQLDLAAMRAGRAVFAGRHDEADEIRRGAVASAPDPEAAGARFASLGFVVPWTRGQHEEAIGMVEGVLAVAPQALPLHGLLALLYLEVGKVAPAREHYEILARDGFPLEPDEFLLIGLTQTALACSYLGDRERAGLLYDRLLPFEARNAAIGEQAVTNGPVALHLGVLEVTLGRWQDAERHLLQAEELARAWGYAAGGSEALLHRGQLMILQGREQGSALIDRALTEAEAHGIARIGAVAEQLAVYWTAAVERTG